MRLFGLIGFCLVAAGALASPVTTAIAARDIVGLESRQSGTAEEQNLAHGAALALRHQDAAALALLLPLSREGVPGEVRAGACLGLADIHLRRMDYAAAHAALRCAEEQSGVPLTGEPLQILHDTAALAGEKPMVMLHPASGTLNARRDRAGLLRLPVSINATDLTAVIDTDASFSVVGQATARRLGLRILPEQLHIVTASRADQPMHLAVADRLQFGGAEFSDVVFAVLPDDAVRFGPDYRMEAVIGLPVLVALGRIGFDNDARVFVYDRGGAVPAMTPNLLLSGLDPFVLVASAGATLRLALDTAADKTTLTASAVTAAPELGASATRGTASWQGAGGAATDYDARLLARWTFSLGGQAVTLKRVPVLSQAEPDRHGLLGLDALKTARRWTIDFDAMCLWLEP